MPTSASNSAVRHILLLLAITSGVAGCGQTTGSSSTGGDSGSSGSGSGGAGTAGSGSGGSGGSSGSGGAPAQGGTSLYVGPGTASPTRGCTRAGTGSYAAIPEGNTASSTDPGERVIDGVDGASVTCHVGKQGAGFAFSGALSQGAVAFEISGTVEQGMGSAAIALITPEVLYLSNRDESPASPCVVQVNRGKIDEGYIFASWSCPILGDASEPSLLCQGNGVIVLENCSD